MTASGPAAPKPFILNAFEMSTVSHITFGLWRHPSDRTSEYTSLSYWTDLAKLLDDGGFDALFIADAVGQLDVYGGNADAALADGAQTPVTDPLLAVSAMAAATEHLGFGVTVSTTYEYPYLLARKFSTLDHLTQGRIAWNVVTSLLDSAARNILARDRQISHDDRYAIAGEFIDVAYKLWEGSWEDDAVVRDRESGIYTDPAKVHAIRHEGPRFSVPGAHLSEPSPQRTPVIFQAGTSEAGKEFGARNAEVVFLDGPVEVLRRQTADIRSRAVAHGRRADAIKFITSLLVITGSDDSSAQRKYEEIKQYYSIEGALVLFSASTGVDWSQHDWDTPLEYIETDSSRSALLAYTQRDPSRTWTLRQIYESTLGHSHLVVGGPEKVADELERLVVEGDIDGFNVSYATLPGSFEDFITYVVPELRRRGRIRERTSGKTLRERLFDSDSARLPDDHPAAAHRRQPRTTATPEKPGELTSTAS